MDRRAAFAFHGGMRPTRLPANVLIESAEVGQNLFMGYLCYVLVCCRLTPFHAGEREEIPGISPWDRHKSSLLPV